MSKYVIAGCDLSDKSMVVQWAVDDGPARKRNFSNDEEGRAAMFAFLREKAEESGAGETVFAYEAGPHGFAHWHCLFAAIARAMKFLHSLAAKNTPENRRFRQTPPPSAPYRGTGDSQDGPVPVILCGKNL